MAVKIVEAFYPTDIDNVAVKFKKDTTSVAFGCTGVISGETEMKTVAVKCGGETIKEKSKAMKMTVKVTAHVKIDVYRRIFGITNDGLKPGVYAYGTDSKSEDFSLTADAVDDFDDIVKIMAFPNCSSATGLTFTIDKGNDEVAQMELEFTVTRDDNKKFFYEGFIDEIEESGLVDMWHKAFDSKYLVEGAELPTPPQGASATRANASEVTDALEEDDTIKKNKK